MSFLGIGGNTPQMQTVATPTIALNLDEQAQQQGFVNALQAQAAGGGPSVSTQLLKNNQQAQAASTNALIAGQRGINPGMALRQGLQTNAASNQAAAGQAAAGRQQEQVNAQGLMGNQLNAMQQQNLSAQQAQAQAALGASSLNVGQAEQIGKNQSDLLGGLIKGGGSALGMAAMASGGMVPAYASGGDIDPVPTSLGDPSSEIGKYLKAPVDMVSGITGAIPGGGGKSAFGGGTTSATQGYGPGSQAMAGGPMDAGGISDMAGSLGPMTMLAAHGGRVPALVSPGERYLPPRAVQEVAKGKKSPMHAGEKIKGTPRVGGAKNSYANDTVPKTLESGGIVLPRSVTQAKDAPERAAAFVRAVLAKQGLKK